MKSQKLNDNFAVRVKTQAQSYLQNLPTSVGVVNAPLLSDGAGGSKWQNRISTQVTGTVIDWFANDTGSFYASLSANTTYTFSNTLNGVSASIWLKNTAASAITVTFPGVNKVGGYIVAIAPSQDLVVNFFKANDLIYASVMDNKPTVPTGSVTAFAGQIATIPLGWLLCNGSAVSRTVYSDLFAVISTNHGSGNGSTTFNIPDYRGRFLRGVDGAMGRDPDRTTRTAMNSGGLTGDNVGSIQDGMYQSHNHTADVWKTDSGSNANVTNRIYTDSYFTFVPDGIVTKASGGNETRPINANVNYIIKY